MLVYNPLPTDMSPVVMLITCKYGSAHITCTITSLTSTDKEAVHLTVKLEPYDNGVLGPVTSADITVYRII